MVMGMTGTALGGQLKASLMEGQKFVGNSASGSFREDADGMAGFDLFNAGKDGLQPLLDILSVQEDTADVHHPETENGNLQGFLLSHNTGGSGKTGVGEHRVKHAAVVAHIDNCPVVRNVFLSQDGQLHPA